MSIIICFRKGIFVLYNVATRGTPVDAVYILKVVVLMDVFLRFTFTVKKHWTNSPRISVRTSWWTSGWTSKNSAKTKAQTISSRKSKSARFNELIAALQAPKLLGHPAQPACSTTLRDQLTRSLLEQSDRWHCLSTNSPRPESARWRQYLNAEVVCPLGALSDRWSKLFNVLARVNQLTF